MKSILVFITVLFSILAAAVVPLTALAGIEPQQKELDQAKVSVNAHELEVSTGAISRKWKWTGAGWVTTSLRNTVENREYAKDLGLRCDWSLPGKLDDKSVGELTDCVIRESDDDGFSSKHLEVVSTVNYPKAGMAVQHVVWIFPGAPGIRTQLRVKALPGYVAKGAAADDQPYKDYGGTRFRPGARADLLPLDLSQPNSRRYWGIYNDPGNRLDQSKPMLEEKVINGFPVFQPEVISWASGEAVDYGDRGVIAVKESAKAVNQPAHLTGGFFSGPQGVQITGWGLAPDEIAPDRFRDCWATWSIVYSDGNDGMQMALKRFDAFRYPVFPQRDMFILSNTWGPANPGGMQFTAENTVMKEIPALAEIGVDVLQIDDGWQQAGRGSGAKSFLPKYNNGWKGIKELADKNKIRLGLWVAVRNANLDDLKKNIDELGFIAWKVDYDHLANRGDYEARTAQYRAVMKHAWMKSQFTLCPEYDDPRYGWNFAKEYGSIYFQNNMEGLPSHLTFVPYHVLRQHWFMAKYFPANKLQVLLQNPKRTRKDFSDAYQHSHGYCFAMGIPFVPCFFQLAQHLDDDGKKELKALIAVYKKDREDIFTSITFPIGDEPNNASWTGFQMVSTRRADSGHLLLFRELHNPYSKQVVKLKFLAGKTISITHLRTGEKTEVSVDPEGKAPFFIAHPADYSLLHYTIK
ncbi:MAG: hypothetical protein NTV49_10015 [Kiritimatiellaeota bacterium]|nr:hypothetical protein [Kiritimatiellota bacterium]